MNIFFEPEIVNIFLSINFNIGFGCSKEPSHRDGSFEYPQHMFKLRNKNNNCYLHLPRGQLLCALLDQNTQRQIFLQRGSIDIFIPRVV